VAPCCPFHLIIRSLYSAERTLCRLATIIIVMSRFARATGYDASQLKGLRVGFIALKFPVLYLDFVALIRAVDSLHDSLMYYCACALT
jgi:hypothetical protein